MRTHEIVMRWVTDELASGRLRVGDALPGERSLAETLGVSRGSIREALRTLEALGFLRTATGSGPNAGSIITHEPEQAFVLALTLQLATRHVEHKHIYETRLLVEAWSAEHAETSDWTESEGILEEMERPELPVREFLSLDADFHVSLSRAAGNPLISALMNSLRLSIADHTLARASTLHDWETTAERLRLEHRHILKAVKTGERELARTLMHAHITGYYRETDDKGP